jgi:hypothetical protein
MGKQSAIISGAQGWTFCRVVNLLALLAALLCCDSARAEIGPLVERASMPEVMFGAPAEYDSLLARIAEGGESSAIELLEYADTPWAWRFEVVRRSLELIGDPARKAILQKLADGDLAEAKMVINLVLLEKLGQAGDEAALAIHLKSGSEGRKITTLRCLAAFGEPESSLELALPVLNADDQRIRLAAVWTVGELCRKAGPGKREAGQLGKTVRPLLDDPILQIRLTAAECMQTLGLSHAP